MRTTRLMFALVAVAFGTAAARAQQTERTQVATDVTAAARAFDEGQHAQLRGDFATAAELFELADRTVPSAAALRAAIRNSAAAGNAVHALNLAMRAAVRYPGDAETTRLIEQMVVRLAPQATHLIARCVPDCALAVDGHAAAASARARYDFYVAPGEHEIDAYYDGGSRATRSLELAPGGTEELTLQPSSSTIDTTPPASEPASPPPAPGKRDRRIAPIYLTPAFILTTGVAAALIWSGVDALSARDSYARQPTYGGYRDGLARELRTNTLIGITATLGAATAGLAIFGVRWRTRSLGGLRAAN